MKSITGITAVCLGIGAWVSAGMAHTADAGQSPESGMPRVEMRQVDKSTVVLWNGEELVYLKDNRRIRFRGTTENDHWIGTVRVPAALSWDLDLSTEDYENPKVTFATATNGFTLSVTAEKPSLEGRVTTVLQATWNAQRRNFEYLLSSRIHGSLEKWYELSARSRTMAAARPETATDVQATDYHINRVSQSDRYSSQTPTDEDLYDWFVWSADGRSWVRSPKLHVPFVVRPGSYVTVNYGKEYRLTRIGEYLGFVDEGEGGWITRLVDAAGPMRYSLCWMFFDVHVVMIGGIPARKSAETFDSHYTINFSPILPQECREVIANSSELEWRNRQEYQLPRFRHHTKFDELIDGKNQYAWWPSSYDCFRDDKVGFDDRFSATIKLKAGYAVWYCHSWGKPYDTAERPSGRYRFSARVKTQDCRGSVRLALVHNDGNYFFDRSEKPEDPAQWFYSDPLTGTHDWTEMSLTAELGPRSNTLVMEQEGPGQSWFDNVTIEKAD